MRVFFSKAFKKCALGSQLLHTRSDTVRRSLITDQLATPQLMISRFYQPNEKYRNYQRERNSRFTGITHSNLILKKKKVDSMAKRSVIIAPRRPFTTRTDCTVECGRDAKPVDFRIIVGWSERCNRSWVSGRREGGRKRLRRSNHSKRSTPP